MNIKKVAVREGLIMGKALILLLCLGLCGCATTEMPRSCEISIDSINNNEILSQKSCAVVSGLKEVSTGDLQFQEYASYVK